MSYLLIKRINLFAYILFSTSTKTLQLERFSYCKIMWGHLFINDTRFPKKWNIDILTYSLIYLQIDFLEFDFFT